MKRLADCLLSFVFLIVAVVLMVRSIIRQKPADDYPSENGDGSYP